MDYKKELESFATHFVETSPGNTISAEVAKTPEVVGMRIYDAPIFGYGDATDPLYETYLQEGIIGPHHMRPRDWLPNATSLVSIFLPFSEQVRAANRTKPEPPVWEWMHARIEGQAFIGDLLRSMKQQVEGWGFEVVAPLLDKRFTANEKNYTSNWSERHCAYVCGLGTFALSKGMITRKGIAGRFASFITTLPIEADTRPYTEIYEYCNDCGACVRRCPAGAISLEGGKDHTICQPWVGAIHTEYHPYYGCGRCQTAVPCEAGIPPARKKAASV